MPPTSTAKDQLALDELQQELAHFHADLTPVDRLPHVDTGPAADRLRAATEVGAFSQVSIATTSKVPLGDSWHRLVAKTTSRQTTGILNQVQTWRDQVEWSMSLLLEGLDRYSDHEHAELADHVKFVLERLSDLDSLEIKVAELDRRLSRIESTATPLQSP